MKRSLQNCLVNAQWEHTRRKLRESSWRGDKDDNKKQNIRRLNEWTIRSSTVLPLTEYERSTRLSVETWQLQCRYVYCARCNEINVYRKRSDQESLVLILTRQHRIYRWPSFYALSSSMSARLPSFGEQSTRIHARADI